MKENIFEMGANFSDEWSADNKTKSIKKEVHELKEPNNHLLYFTKEKRRGKIVTIVQPFYMEGNNLKIILKTIKKKLGTGGSIKENKLEFQGEVKENLKVQLEKLDFRFK